MSSPPSILFFALGDWGESSTNSKNLAKAMHAWSLQSGRSPDFILSLGDHFYPRGCTSVTDKKFKTVWEDVFLPYPSLQVPWYGVLGNHDYEGNYQAQIAFTSSPHNPQNLWRMPGKNYSFSKSIGGQGEGKVDFFALDANGCQSHVRRAVPGIEEELTRNIADLSAQLSRKDEEDEKEESTQNRWRIVFGHHPVHTKGRYHGLVARCLAQKSYVLVSGEVKQGYNLEQVLAQGKVDCYISGHEHVLQAHSSSGVEFFVSGATSKIGFYGGEDMGRSMDWVGRGQIGFLAVEISGSQLSAKFVNVQGKEIHSVTKRK